jgi:hypothetical protein
MSNSNQTVAPVRMDNTMGVNARVDRQTNIVWIKVHRCTEGFMGAPARCTISTDWMTFAEYKIHPYSNFGALLVNEEFTLQGRSFLCTVNSTTSDEELDEDCVRREWLLRARILGW